MREVIFSEAITGRGQLADAGIVYAEAVTRIYLDRSLGLLSVEHTGEINWETLQSIKAMVWGADTCAIEVYPPRHRVVNNLPMRHLWKLGPDDWWPDLGREGAVEPGTLRERYFGEGREQ